MKNEPTQGNKREKSLDFGIVPHSSALHLSGVVKRPGIVLVADRELTEWLAEHATPLSWYSYQSALLNGVNGIYEREIGVGFFLMYQCLDNNNTHLTSNDKDALLYQLEDYISIVLGDLNQENIRQGLGVEVAHLTTGRNIVGNTIGYAYEPGHYGLSQQGFETVQGYRFALWYQNIWIMAHELGHNFSGTHKEADKWCAADFLICLDWKRSLMWETFYDDNEDEFSHGNRNPNHNNRQRVRDSWDRTPPCVICHESRSE